MKGKILKGLIWRILGGPSRLGSKTEPYYESEEEMLKEKEYTYESLSLSEKKIYNESRTDKQSILQEERKK